MQACSVLHVALVLVGVRRVTVVHIVHIGYEDVLVVMHFCVAILFVIFLYQEMFSLQLGPSEQEAMQWIAKHSAKAREARVQLHIIFRSHQLGHTDVETQFCPTRSP